MKCPFCKKKGLQGRAIRFVGYNVGEDGLLSPLELDDSMSISEWIEFIRYKGLDYDDLEDLLGDLSYDVSAAIKALSDSSLENAEELLNKWQRKVANALNSLDSESSCG